MYKLTALYNIRIQTIEKNKHENRNALMNFPQLETGEHNSCAVWGDKEFRELLTQMTVCYMHLHT